MEELIIKYLNDSLTPEEFGQLEIWLEDPDNRKKFEAYIRSDYDLQHAMRTGHSTEAYDAIRKHLDEPGHTRILPVWWRSAAAGLILLVIGAAALYQTGFFEKTPLLIPGNEDITIEWADGRVEVLSPGHMMDIQDLESEVATDNPAGSAEYDTTTGKDESIYNTLRVPYGKKFEIALADGTAVHLQSGTSLRFPTRFSTKGIRQIFLEGEAYFQVVENKAIPFVVSTDQLNVEVTGTAFNVSAYPEDTYIDVVLEEGGVGLYHPQGSLDEGTMLIPGYIGSLDRRDNTISTQKVNTQVYTNWLEGKLTFRNMSFDNILKKLERHYNITMVNQNQKLGAEIFNASFDKDETIENVLSFFNESYKIEFAISDNTVIIQ